MVNRLNRDNNNNKKLLLKKQQQRKLKILRDHVHWNDYSLDHTFAVAVARIDRNLLKIHEQKENTKFRTHVVSNK